MERFDSFCKYTTLHGWQYMADKSFNRVQKLFWAIVLFISICVATLIIYNSILVFRSATVVTTIETMNAPLTDVFFPSVTVCNLNQARKSFFEEIGIYDNHTLIRNSKLICRSYYYRKSRGLITSILYKYTTNVHKEPNFRDILLILFLPREGGRS